MSADTGSSGEGDQGLPDLPGPREFAERNGQHHPIAEFLYQLTKMLTDDNSEIIEWSDGRIKVHFPERLEAEVLHKYFRHSKFASFQRQLNYFGFRKIAGKGKMSPCSYVNEAATSDIRSLLLIKRKTNGSAARKAAMQQRSATATGPTVSSGLNGLNGVTFPGIAAQPGQVAVLNGQLSNAMALLTENALRAGLGQLQLPQIAPTPGAGVTTPQLNLLALQQQTQLAQQLAQQQFAQAQQQVPGAQSQVPLLSQDNHQAASAFLKQAATAAAPVPVAAPVSGAIGTSQTPSLEQLQAQLNASLAGKQSLTAASLLGPSLNLASNPASAALQLGSAQTNTHVDNPASAALKALDAQAPTPASDAAASAPQTTNNLFESALNLKTLLSEHNANQEAARNGVTSNGASAAVHPVTSTALMHRLPSSGTIFPDMTTATSVGNLLGSSNRLSSLLSLNSFLGSREQSLADFAAANTMTAQLAAGAGATAGLQQYASDANNFRNPNQ